jgi:RNase P subunit RPR2
MDPKALARIHNWSKIAPDFCVSCAGTLVRLPSSKERVRISPFVWYQCQECKDVYPTRERDDSRLRTARNKVFDILGGTRCVCRDPSCWHSRRPCGISDARCLQFDHIGGEGYAHRFGKNYHQQPTRKFYEFYVENEELATNELRVLCANCNFIKRVKEKECSKSMKIKARPRQMANS